MEKVTKTLTTEQIRERHRRKKLKKRRIFIARMVLVVIVICFGVIAMNLTKSGMRSLLGKEAVFVTKMTDTVAKKNDHGLENARDKDLINLVKGAPVDKLVCYLTFDDGPNDTNTLKIADILRRYGIKATFFQVGSHIEEFPAVTKRLYSEGHLIGNHSYNHNYSELYASTDAFMSEINHAQSVIDSTIGKQDFKIVRFPGGSHNAGTYGAIKQDCKQAAMNSGYYTCDWNALNGDTETPSKTGEQLLERTKSTVGQQAQPIILMHDSKKKTVDVLPQIIEYLLGEGYTFETLDKVTVNENATPTPVPTPTPEPKVVSQ